MHVNYDRLRYLLQRSAAKECSREEMEELYDSIAAVRDEELYPLLEELYQGIDPSIRVEDIDWEAMFNRMTEQVSAGSRSPVVSRNSRSVPVWLRYSAAAVVVLGAATLFLVSITHSHKPSAQGPVALTPVAGDIAPGGNKAILTLANGSSIVLDSAATGVLAKQGNADVVKQAGGGLAYRSLGTSPGAIPNAAVATTAVLYNTLTVPRGGQYHLILSDGSQVWLNAASSLRYPTTFTSGERRVEIIGEAYFEVAANASMPFRVTGGGMEVQVLGTQFDMNAYEDAPFARTTLVKGSVRVGNDGNHFTIVPGEQAQLVGGGLRVLRAADVDGEIAWKEGRFAFEETDLREVMRQVARWYDVEVEYRGEVDGRRFTADISRGRSLSTLLKALEATSNIHFKIQGRQLIVTP